MSKWKYEWRVDFYTSGNYLKTLYFQAKSREDALHQLHTSGVKVIEVLRCRRIDTW